jgi:hypothetical protein
VGAVTTQTVNQGLFRLYAVVWFVFAATVLNVVYAATDVPGAAVVIYAAIGFGLWLIDMMVTKGGPQGHALSHAVLVAAFAVIWPFVIAALTLWFGVTLVRAVAH